MGASVIVPSVDGGERLRGLVDSLAAQSVEHELIVLDNGSQDGSVRAACAGHPSAEVVCMGENAGFGRAVNRGVELATGEALVLVNDDCRCDPGFVEAIAAALDPASDVVMAAGILRDARDPGLIDSAGMELDRTLLPFDYLNGRPLSVLGSGVANPIAPSAAAAAFDRAAFREVGGFDENLFAYWEDVDLVLRVLLAGGRCALAPAARGHHEHSATLGSGSSDKNYLMGFGRGYILRKWRVASATRLPAILLRDVTVCAGQLLLDRNAAGIRGRVDGLRASRPVHEYPRELLERERTVGASATLWRRAARRRRLRRREATEQRSGA